MIVFSKMAGGLLFLANSSTLEENNDDSKVYDGYVLLVRLTYFFCCSAGLSCDIR